jgi:MFS family permease
VGLINLVFTLVAMAYIDRIGRKPLLNLGLSGIALSMFILAYGFSSATYTLSSEALTSLPAGVDAAAVTDIRDVTYESDIEYKKALQSALGEEVAREHESELINAAIAINPWLVLLGVLGFVASFAVSIGPVMWVLFSELFSNRIRGVAISFVGLINSAVSFGVQFIFPWELANLGSATTFLLYGLFAAVGLAFVISVVPETKGRSLEELETLLVRSPSGP